MKPKIFLQTTFIILLLSFVYTTQAGVRYVSKTGSSKPPYKSGETTGDSIMECIDIPVFGDSIYVANSHNVPPELTLDFNSSSYSTAIEAQSDNPE